MANDILVCGEIRGGELKKVVKELIGTARLIAQNTSGSIDAVLIGESLMAADDIAAKVRELLEPSISPPLWDGALNHNYSSRGKAKS